MKRRIISSLLAGLLVISFAGTSLIADDNNSRDQSDAGSSQGSEIDPDLNQQLITYLENLDETELDPDRNIDTSDHLSDEEILRQSYLEQMEALKDISLKDGWRDQFDTVSTPRTDPTGFYSIGSDIYYTDPSTGVRYCNTTLTYEHIVFTFGSDYKVTSFAAQQGYESRRRVKVLLEAFSHIGAPYDLEADPPLSFACGRFVQYVYLTSLGVRQDWASCFQIEGDFYNSACTNNNASLDMHPQCFDSLSDLLPGDLIYWYNPACAANPENCPIMTHQTNEEEDPDYFKGVHHTAIYIGNGQVIEAVDNNTVHCVIVGDIRQMNGLQIFYDYDNGDPKTGYVRLIKEDATLACVTELQATPAGKYKVSLTWTGNRYADGYLIYARKNGVYGYCGITYGTTLVNDTYVGSFTDTNALSSGNGYYVFPYVTDYSGTMYPGAVSVMVTGEGICLPVTDLDTSNDPDNGYVVVSWSESSDADGYLIYGYHNGGSYGLIGSKNGRDNTTFIDSTASSTITSYYWVFAFYRENGNVIPGLAAGPVSGKAR